MIAHIICLKHSNEEIYNFLKFSRMSPQSLNWNLHCFVVDEGFRKDNIPNPYHDDIIPTWWENHRLDI